MPRFWLLKSEPGTYSILDLERDRATGWEGVRNYQARNFMRDEMQPGDGVLFYHSNADPPGVAGLARVSRAGHPDLTAQDPGSKYFDAEDPRWFQVEITFERRFRELISLSTLRATPGLGGMPLLNRSRLSVQPVSEEEWKIITGVAGL